MTKVTNESTTQAPSEAEKESSQESAKSRPQDVKSWDEGVAQAKKQAQEKNQQELKSKQALQPGQELQPETKLQQQANKFQAYSQSQFDALTQAHLQTERQLQPQNQKWQSQLQLQPDMQLQPTGSELPLQNEFLRDPILQIRPDFQLEPGLQPLPEFQLQPDLQLQPEFPLNPVFQRPGMEFQPDFPLEHYFDLRPELLPDTNPVEDTNTSGTGLSLQWDNTNGLNAGDSMTLGDMDATYSHQYTAGDDTYYVANNPAQEDSEVVFTVNDDNTANITQINGHDIVETEYDPASDTHSYYSTGSEFSLTADGIVEERRGLGSDNGGKLGPEEGELEELIEVAGEEAVETSYLEALGPVGDLVAAGLIAGTVIETFREIELTEEEQRQLDESVNNISTLETNIQNHIAQGRPQDPIAASAWDRQLEPMIGQLDEELAKATSFAANKGLDTSELEAKREAVTTLLGSRPDGPGTATISDILTSDKLKDEMERTLSEQGIPASVNVGVEYGDNGEPRFGFDVRLEGSVGDLAPDKQNRLHSLVSDQVGESLSELGYNTDNQGAIAISDTNGAVKPAPASASADNSEDGSVDSSDDGTRAGVTAELEANIVSVGAKVDEIENLQEELDGGGVPEGFANRADAEARLGTLQQELSGLLDDGIAALNGAGSGLNLGFDDKEAYAEAANLVGGHDIANHPATRLTSDTVEALEEMDYEEGTDFTVLDDASHPNCHTYTMSHLGLEVDQTEPLTDPTAMFNEHFNEVGAIPVTEEMNADNLDAALVAAGAQDGDVFAFSTTNDQGETITHSGIIRIDDNGMRFESVFGLGNPLIETPPIVTLDYYRLSADNITIYRQNDEE